MARIQITGYIDTDDLNPDQVDLEHASGLSEKGFMDLQEGRLADLGSLDDLDTTVVP